MFYNLVNVLNIIWQKCLYYMGNVPSIYGKWYIFIWEVCQIIYGKSVTGK